MRKDMPARDWNAYKLLQLEFLVSPTQRRDKQEALEQAEALDDGRRRLIDGRIDAMVEEAGRLGAAMVAPVAHGAHGGSRLKAENALYGAALEGVEEAREVLLVRQALHRAGMASMEDVRAAMFSVQKALHHGAMFANEAYITAGPVLHVVGNLQVLKGRSLQIGLTIDDYLASANEQVAFIFDDFFREGEPWKGLLKAGKYIERLGHAAQMIEAALAVRRHPAPKMETPPSAKLKTYGAELAKVKDLEPEDRRAAIEAVNKRNFEAFNAPTLDWPKKLILAFLAQLQAMATEPR
jgi:hypothetical protein